MTAYTDLYNSLSLNPFKIQMIYRISVTVSILIDLAFSMNQNPISLFSKNCFLLDNDAKIMLNYIV